MVYFFRFEDHMGFNIFLIQFLHKNENLGGKESHEGGRVLFVNLVLGFYHCACNSRLSF
jgi:hypothetical protein